jgi:hypothetical protein
MHDIVTCMSETAEHYLNLRSPSEELMWLQEVCFIPDVASRDNSARQPCLWPKHGKLTALFSLWQIARMVWALRQTGRQSDKNRLSLLPAPLPATLNQDYISLRPMATRLTKGALYDILGM